MKRNSKSLFDKIINTTQECIFWKDTDRKFAGANRAFRDYFGFASDEGLIGRTVEDLGWHKNPQPFMEDELRILQGESTYKMQGILLVNGEERDILVSKAPIYEEGEIVGLVGSFLDVTESMRREKEIESLKKNLEKALRDEKRANRKTSDLIARLRLEMKNPLDAIYTISYMDRYAEDPELLAFDMRRVHAASNYLTALSRDLTDINYIDNANLQLEEKECAFEMIIDGIETVIRPMAEEKGLEFTVVREYDRKKRLVCDPGRVQQIAINLLLNAVRFTDEGFIRFTAKATEWDDRFLVTLIVQDSGCGIGEDFIPRMYDLFAREKRNPNKYGKGSGLGLSIAKRLTELMHGSISVDSEVNYGTTFTVKLIL